MSGGYGNSKLLLLFSGKLLFLRKYIGHLYPPMPTINSMRPKLIYLIQNMIFKENNIVLNYGVGISKGSGAKLWKTLLLEKTKIIHCDLLLQNEVDVVADAHKLPFKNNSFHSLVCQAVLEHVQNPKLVVEEMRRVLKSNGIAYVEVPFLQGFHADPHDYQRYTQEGLKVLFKDFEILKSGVSVGPFCSLVWLLRDGISSFFSNKFLYYLTRFIVAWILAPIKYLDFLIIEKPLYKKLACENFILVKKNKK